MSVTLSYPALLGYTAAVYALGMLTRCVYRRVELADLTRFRDRVEEIDRSQLSGEHPIVSDPTKAVAVPEVVRVTLTARAYNTAEWLAARLGGLVLPFIALGALLYGRVADWRLSRRVIDVVPVSAPPVAPRGPYRGQHWRPEVEHTGQIPRVPADVAADSAELVGADA